MLTLDSTTNILKTAYQPGPTRAIRTHDSRKAFSLVIGKSSVWLKISFFVVADCSNRLLLDEKKRFSKWRRPLANVWAVWGQFPNGKSKWDWSSHPLKNPLFHTFKPILSFLSLQFLQLGILFVTVHAYLPDLRATDPCVDTCWKLTKYTFKWKITLMSWTNPGSSCFIVAWKVGGKKGHELLKKLALPFVEEWDYLTNFLFQECC